MHKHTKVLEINVDDLYSGGVFSLVRNIIRNNDNNDITIDLAALEMLSEKNVDELKEYGTTVHYFGAEDSGKVKKQVIIYKKLKKILANNNYEYVHIHSDTAIRLFIFGLAAKTSNVNHIILHSHAADVDGEKRFIKYLLHITLRIFLGMIGTEFVACSKKAYKWMFPLISYSKTEIIYNGIDIKNFRFDENIRQNIRKQLGVNKEVLIGHVGRFDYTKNHTFMLRIAKELKNRNFNFKYVFVGSGPWFSEMVELSRKFDIADKCIFYGESDHVNKLYNAMDVFTLPSKNEGFGICAIEAQAAGLPCLFSNNVPSDVNTLKRNMFIGIREADINKWCCSIVDLSKKRINRNDSYFEIEKASLSIDDTVKRFLRLYGDDE